MTVAVVRSESSTPTSKGPRIAMALILLIEDDVQDARVVRRVLEASRLPHELLVLGDGGDALDYLFGVGRWTGRDVNDQPELVLVDLALPTMGGYEVVRELRADPVTRLLRVVMLTASRDHADLLRSYGAGANGYIVKPRDLSTFGAATRQLLDYWLHLNARMPCSPPCA